MPYSTFTFAGAGCNAAAEFGLVVACRSLIDGATVSILAVSDFSVWFVALSVAWQSIWWMPWPETLIVQVREPALQANEVGSIRFALVLQPVGVNEAKCIVVRLLANRCQ